MSTLHLTSRIIREPVICSRQFKGKLDQHTNPSAGKECSRDCPWICSRRAAIIAFHWTKCAYISVDKNTLHCHEFSTTQICPKTKNHHEKHGCLHPGHPIVSCFFCVFFFGSIFKSFHFFLNNEQEMTPNAKFWDKMCLKYAMKSV